MSSTRQDSGPSVECKTSQVWDKQCQWLQDQQCAEYRCWARAGYVGPVGVGSVSTSVCHSVQGENNKGE